MKLHNFDQERANERLKADRQAITCVVFIALLNLVAALGFKFDAMSGWAVGIWLLGDVALITAAVIFALRPEWKARKLERDMWHEDNGSYVQPHQ